MHLREPMRKRSHSQSFPLLVEYTNVLVSNIQVLIWHFAPEAPNKQISCFSYVLDLHQNFQVLRLFPKKLSESPGTSALADPTDYISVWMLGIDSPHKQLQSLKVCLVPSNWHIFSKNPKEQSFCSNFPNPVGNLLNFKGVRAYKNISIHRLYSQSC